MWAFGAGEGERAYKREALPRLLFVLGLRSRFVFLFLARGNGPRHINAIIVREAVMAFVAGEEVPTDFAEFR